MTTVLALQRRLSSLGIDPGPADGLIGPSTLRAINLALDKLPGAPAAPVAVSGKFDAGSAKRLAQAHPMIQKVMNAAREKIAFSIMDSQRGRAAQEYAYKRGTSKARFGQSAHNWSPAIAVDIAPVPLDWNDTKAFKALATVILPIAKEMGVPLRWGGDWNMDGSSADGWDFPHYELHPWREFSRKCKPYEG